MGAKMDSRNALTYEGRFLQRHTPMSPAVTIAVALVLIALGAFGTYLLKVGIDDWRAAKRIPNISFQKIALFWVNVDEGIYQLGAVAKLFNGESTSYSIKGLTFEGRNWTFFPRGSYHVRRLAENVDHAELMEDNYLKPNSEKYLKKLLPIKFDMTINGGETPEFVVRGKWNLIFGENRIQETPNLFSVHTSPISSHEWDDLLKPQSTINVESFYYKPIPERPPADVPDLDYMVYSPDRSTRVDNPYFAQTVSVKNQNGILVFIRGKGEPPLANGWVVLGHTYYEVWSDPKKLALYNSLVPPDKDGNPQPFGFFAGLQNEMVGPIDRAMSAPTTRAADILEFTWPEANK
jgi:hypothetical protein